MEVETLLNVEEGKLKEKVCDAIEDRAVKFEATKNDDGTWTVKTTFRASEALAEC